MLYTDYSEDIVSEKELQSIYQEIKKVLIEGKSSETEKCTIILGGQPGAGKSSFYELRDELIDYIPINGDEYRRFHPNYKNIIKTDPEHYAERTQSFSNRIVEALIKDLGSSGYNLIIEGTLRNPDVPIKTCKYLKSKGYEPELVVVACNAEKSWRSTISRAALLHEQGFASRLVPIDIYNTTVNQIPLSLDKIEKENCFKKITIINRDGDILYTKGKGEKASDVLRKELSLEEWNQNLPKHEDAFVRAKIELLQASLDKNKGFDISDS